MGKQHLGPHVVVGYGIKIFWPGLFITRHQITWWKVVLSARDLDSNGPVRVEDEATSTAEVQAGGVKFIGPCGTVGFIAIRDFSI